MNKVLLACWVLIWPVVFLFSSSLSAQTILPELSGQALLDGLRTAYRPASVLTYGQARDLLYGEIDRVNDSLYCVYTGLGISMTPGADPSSDAFAKGINTEHTYPRSKGADNGFPESDMHHLFPTRIEVNGDRGSLPFGDIPDNQTDRWYFRSQERTSPPAASVRDQYSEILTNGRFEPREDHKGNVARAVFYFYTVYGNEARAADPNFFDAQVDDLCQWHRNDPVDLKELERTQAIAVHQDGKVNPFVVDCALLQRTYCPDLGPTDCVSNTTEPTPIRRPFEVLGVGHANGERFILLQLSEEMDIRVDWMDMLGRSLRQQSSEEVGTGIARFTVKGGDFTGSNTGANSQATGPLLARFQLRDRNGHWFLKTVLLP